MFPKSDRRILTFPALHPCPEVSPATLLGALIDLCRDISEYHNESFVTQKRNAKECIREVEILRIFFQEIRDWGLCLLESVVLAFSELYIAFNKILYLLQDCTCEGARLFILMKSKQVSTEFRILIRMIATALDVLPMAAIDVSVEVRELVGMVAKQSWKVKIEIDPIDERVMKDVVSILGQFENKMVPDSRNLKRVLVHLGIRSWNECNREFQFLEEEIGSHNSNKKDKEITLLSSLMGFLSYCQVVLFREALDGRHKDQLECKYDGKALSYLNPEDFLCPISLEIMTDPVTLVTGQTYDRRSILKWLKSGNHICPKTGEKLKNTQLVPNSALRKLVQQFCYNNGIPVVESGERSRDLSRTIMAGSSVAAEATRMLAIFIVEKLSTGTKEERNKAAYEIRVLTKSSIFNRACLVEAGSIPWLINLLCSTSETTQENAIAALLNLSKHYDSKAVIVESGGVDPILDVLRKGLKVEARQLAAATLFYLSSVDKYRKLIGETPGAIPALVELLRNGTPRGKKNAMVALFGLLLFPENYGRVLEARAVPLLVNLLNSERADLVNDSLSVLAVLAEKHEGTNAILRTSAAPLLVEILHSSSSRTGQEYCVSALLSLCINGGAEAIAILRKMPSLMASLYSLVMEGISRACKKASTLLNLLHGFHFQGCPSTLTPVIQQEQVVHVQ